MDAPKLFISYSWTSQDHEAWVLNLAEDLTSSGVDVLLDKWHLLDGHDTHAFMERANDPSINKVAMICDKEYVTKANGRTGGVGIEAQIITPGVYASHDQTKYVAVVVERNEDGSACVPVYYGSKKYIDFTDVAKEAASFEQLQRWIFDKPLYVRPAIGSRPAFLKDSANGLHLATGPAQRRAVDAVRNARATADAAISEYFDVFISELEKLRVACSADDYDEIFISSIESYTAFRKEMVDVFSAIASYRDSPETRALVRSLFERLIPLLDRPEATTSWNDTDFDNFKFIAHELFLYAFAAYLKHQRFDAAQSMIDREYYTGTSTVYHNQSTVGYNAFRTYLKTLEWRNQRLNLRRTSLHADLLHDRCVGLPIDFYQMMEADFVLYLHSTFHSDSYDKWYPLTLQYNSRNYRAFPIFGRAKSAAYFSRVAGLLNVSTAEQFREKVDKISKDRDSLPSWNYNRLDVKMSSGADFIASAR